MSDSFEYIMRQSERHWDDLLRAKPVLGKLKLCWSYLARLDVQDQSSPALPEQREHIKGKVAEFLRVADPSAVLADYDCWRLVLKLFSAPGLRRLEARVQERRQAA